jgi:hypothetical protein
MFFLVQDLKIQLSRGLVLTMILGLGAGCDESKNKRGQHHSSGSNANCEGGLALGQSKTTVVFKKTQAALGESCSSLSFETTATCEINGITLRESGDQTCVETQLKKLTISAATRTLGLGDKTALNLEGTDQFGKIFPVGTDIAKWTSSSPKVTISKTGLLEALDEVTDAEITAEVNDIKSEPLTITVKALNTPRKSCSDTADGATKMFMRFAQSSVPFNASCKEISVNAVCENGEFNFGNDTSYETCSPAKLVDLNVKPQILSLLSGEQGVLDISAVDDKGNVVQLNGSQIEWTYDVTSLSIETSSASVSLIRDIGRAQSVVALKFSGKTASFLVQQKVLEPTALKFTKENYLFKKGDKIDLVVEALNNGSAININQNSVKFSSTSPTDVQIVENQLEVLTAGGKFDLIAEYSLGSGAVLKAQAKVAVEDDLTVTSVKPEESAVITADTRDAVHTGNLIVKGPAEGIPALTSSDKACQFVLQYREAEQTKFYEVLVELDTRSEAIPSVCEATIVSKTAAGQTVEVKQKALVDYIRWTYTEISEVGQVATLFPVAKLSYKTSNNINLDKVELIPYENKGLKPETCSISYTEEPGAITVSAFLDDSVEFCASRVKASFTSQVSGVRSITQPVTVSSQYKTFFAYCEDLSPSVQDTITVLRRVTGLTSCNSMNKWLQDKNVNGTYFQLGMDRLSSEPEITNLAPLARLVYMDALSLNRHAKLNDLSPLKHLQFLNRLKLIGTAVQDFSPLYDRVGLNVTLDARIRSLECSKSAVKNASISKLCIQE